jgi:cytochrome c-type biogenesis protein CcmH
VTNYAPQFCIYIQYIRYSILILFFCATSYGHQYSATEIAAMQNIRCPICNGQSIYDSNNIISQEMRNMVVHLYGQNKSQSAIEKAFEEKFGPDILIDQSKKQVSFLYIAPLLILFVLLLRVFFKYKAFI